MRPELINDITTHTTMGGRAPYSRSERLELVQASRQADGAVVKPVETAARFGADRSAPRADVFLSPSGLITAVLASSSRAFSCVAVIMAPVMYIVLCRSQFGVLEDTMPIYRIAVDPRQRFGSNLSSPSPSSEGLGVVFSAVPESHQESS